jgi:hypothetical protein
MIPTGTPPSLENLPPELTAEVLASMPVKDILVMKQVRRLHDRVQRF